MCRSQILAALAITGIAFPVVAEIQPDAGRLLRDIEQRITPELPKRGEEIAPPPVPPTPEADGPTVTVSAFRFAGNTLLSAEQLAEIVKPFLGRPLRLTDLRAAAQAVADRYRQDGWLIRAYLPRQEIIDGVVTIQIVEAKFGGVLLQGNLTRAPATRIVQTVERAQPVGAPVHLGRIERSVLLINDLPGAQARAALQTGRREGETDLVLEVADAPRLDARLIADNAGTRSTGDERVVGLVSLHSPAGLGDQAVITAMASSGSSYGRLDYSLPFGYDGLRAGVAISALNYELGKNFASLNAGGTAGTSGISLSYPLRRSRFTNIYLSGRYDHKTFTNDSLGATVSDYSASVATFEVAANHYDRIAGGGVTTVVAALTRGRLDLGGSPNQAADAATTQTEGSYFKQELSVSRLQAMRPTSAVYLSLSAQSANQNLDSSEHFSIGGPRRVRAYPTNEGSGDEGRVLTLEWREQLRSNLRLDIFYDHGWTRLNADNNFPGAPALNSYQLKGVGLAVNWKPASALDVSATWAHRLGNNPNRAADGKDQDGSLMKERIWLSASYRF